MSYSPDDVPRTTGSQDDLPVEDLLRLTREFTRRVTNQDRQRLALDLRASGHQRALQHTAPTVLQRFFAGEIDLDTDLLERFPNAPLMSHVKLPAQPSVPLGHQATAVFACQDDSVTMTVEVPVSPEPDKALELTFSLYSTLSLRFSLAPLPEADCRRWLDLMQRDNGITFLWSHQRWEAPYAIVVIREGFARVYAFSSHGFEAAVRMTPDMVLGLVDWLGGLWLPGLSLSDAPRAESPLDERGHQATLPRLPDALSSDSLEDGWDESDLAWDASADSSAEDLEW